VDRGKSIIKYDYSSETKSKGTIMALTASQRVEVVAGSQRHPINLQIRVGEGQLILPAPYPVLSVGISPYFASPNLNWSFSR